MLTGDLQNPVLNFSIKIKNGGVLISKSDSNNKIIEGFERYTIDDNGNVYDTKRHKEVFQWTDTTGYKQCVIRDNDNKKTHKRIHRLVAQTFLPNPNNLPQVNHKNGNKLENNINNLEWCTNRENTQHGYDNGLYRFKSRSHKIDVYKKNGEFLKQFKSIRSMCEELGINSKTGTMILTGEKTTNNYNYIFKYAEEN